MTDSQSTSELPPKAVGASAAAGPRLGYRADIDGLRAIAVIAVVLFHLDTAYMPGGFLGVDVFFVISGFLITGLIRKGIDEGNFTIAGFYRKRITRLMPALMVVLGVTFAVAWWWMWPSGFSNFCHSAKYVVLSIANYFFLTESKDYFGEGARSLPLLHTWSLAVEEQYYLVFPGLLLLLRRNFQWGRGVVLALGMVMILSLAACVIHGREHPMSSFFLLPFRGWEMMIGSLLAFQAGKIPGLMVRSVLATIGLVLVAGSMVLVRESNLVPGLSAVPVCVGAAMLISAGNGGGTFVNRVLGTRPLVGIGLISYSFYLWHWPVIVFSEMIFDSHGAQTDVALLLVSAGLGWGSWKFVEQPFRVRGRFSSKRIFATWAAATIAIIACSDLIRAFDGLPSRFSNEVVALLRDARIDPTYKVDDMDLKPGSLAATFGDRAAAPKIALWGDSHAEAMLPVLDGMAQERGKSFLIYKIRGQVPVPGFIITREGNSEKEQYTQEVLNELVRDAQLETVVLHGRWAWPIWGCDVGGTPRMQNFVGLRFRDREALEKSYGEHLQKVIQTLLEAGKRVIVIEPVPELTTHATKYLAREMRAHGKLPEFLPLSDFLKRNRSVLASLDAIPDSPSLLRIRPSDRLVENGHVRISHHGNALYRDTNHLTNAGTYSIEELLEPIFE